MAKTYYVTATDTFLSGWGAAEGKTNKLVFPCASYQQAHALMRKLDERDDMKRVSIRQTKPHYPESTHYTQYKTPEEFGVAEGGEAE